MAYMHTTHAAAHDSGLFGRISSFFAGLAERNARYRLYRETVNELAALDNRELTDLGLTRSQITSVAHAAVYGR